MSQESSKTYTPQGIESKWYERWISAGAFRSTPKSDKAPFTIVIPPPNVTGVLHMGHMLNNTIQDVLVRKARMQGFEACWVPGTDHASIATEAKVVRMLADQGIQKTDLSREDFLKHAFDWKDKYGGIILEQLKKLGASCDWDRTRFTMDPQMSEAVIETFIHLYKKNLIYRGIRMVNWDPKAQTAVSDEEVIYKEGPSRLYYVQYKAVEGEGAITVATTRPETILGDTAVCVNPNDERYTHWIGKKVFVPLINREVPVIADEYVDAEFGTGALKITPAHDINDYQIGLKHNLPAIDTIAADGTMSEQAGMYIGEDRFIVRKKIAKELDAQGLLVKTEDIQNKVGYSERTDAVIEPKLSVQWFVRMEAMAKPALDAVMDGRVVLHPAKFVNTYRHWMENVKDWCISRQLWWGQRIPAWYDGSGDFVVARNLEEAVAAFAEKGKQVDPNILHQDEDVVDTWFSSWLWPLTVFDPEIIRKPLSECNEDLRYYYPTQDLVTAPEILFFWVARMIMAGLEFTGEVPFKNVYLTGIVRDKLGRKMSKSLGNSPDPLDLIEKYGADGVRLGMLLSSPAGNDLPFDEALCVQGRNFANKIWNAFRLISQWSVSEEALFEEEPVKWFHHTLNKTIAELEDHYSKYRLSEAVTLLYRLVWDDFCSTYLEMIKPGFGQPVHPKTREASIQFFNSLLHLIHPIMPFISEELWHDLNQSEESRFLCLSPYPIASEFSEGYLRDAQEALEMVSTLRNYRAQKNISPKVGLSIWVETDNQAVQALCNTVCKLTNCEINESSQNKGNSLVVGKTKIFVDAGDAIDTEKEKEKLKADLAYLQGFLESVRKKLSNERFVQNAKPEILENERNKERDALEKIKLIEESLNA